MGLVLSEEKILKVVDTCNGGLLLRFKNDLGGRDTVIFEGDYAVRYQGGDVQSIDRFVTDFSPAGESGRTEVLKTEIVESIQASRFYHKRNAEGMKQLLTSRWVEMFTGVINDTPENQREKWLRVEVRERGNVEKLKNDLCFMTIEVMLPKRFVDER